MFPATNPPEACVRSHSFAAGFRIIDGLCVTFADQILQSVPRRVDQVVVLIRTVRAEAAEAVLLVLVTGKFAGSVRTSRRVDHDLAQFL